MPEKTDGFEIAAQLSDAAEAVMQRLLADYDRLSKDEARELEDLFWDLQGNAARVRTIAVGTLLAEAETSMKELAAETKKARKAIKDLGRVRDAIVVATALFDLAGAIATRNTSGLKQAFNGLKTVLKEPAKKLAKDVVKKVTG